MTNMCPRVFKTREIGMCCGTSCQRMVGLGLKLCFSSDVCTVNFSYVTFCFYFFGTIQSFWDFQKGLGSQKLENEIPNLKLGHVCEARRCDDALFCKSLSEVQWWKHDCNLSSIILILVILHRIPSLVIVQGHIPGDWSWYQRRFILTLMRTICLMLQLQSDERP